MYFKEHKLLQKVREQQWMEGIQVPQLLTWKYVPCEKNCPPEKAVEDTSPSGYRRKSGKARGREKCSKKESWKQGSL